ncbi:hypothetical protein FQA47_024951 [Oryzias melastigma]|uniref:Uncharacterized protein n=1 Tax=Oryzias melastigma TaxID=30732 RepID=A0A834BYI9_ORYME|nr:hypothetical protein FQA47_024951 [Oryzias melastigma]
MINMMRTIAMTFLIRHAVASLDCSECQFKIENGEYHYIPQVTSNKTYDSFTWKNDTNHPVATKRNSSVFPVKASSPEMLVSVRDLGNLTLNRYYNNENGRINEEIVLCCVSPHTDNILGHTTPSVSPGGGQPGIWTAVAWTGGAVLVLALVVVAIVTLKKYFWKPKNKEDYTPGTPRPASLPVTFV